MNLLSPAGSIPKMRSGGLLLLTLLLLLAAPAVAFGQTIDDQTREIAKQLQCPVCEGVTVADSPVELAVQMRGTIREKLQAGETRGHIIQFFVERYGPEVLVEPPREGLALAVWWGPVVVLFGGVALLAGILRSWLRRVRGSRAGSPETPLNGHASGTESPVPSAEWTNVSAKPRPMTGGPELGSRDSGLSVEERARREFEEFRRSVGG